MKIEEIQRVFTYNGTTLADPTTDMSPEEVKNFYSGMYPDLLNASIESEYKGSKLHCTFRKTLGTKA